MASRSIFLPGLSNILLAISSIPPETRTRAFRVYERFTNAESRSQSNGMERPARSRPWRGALLVALALVALWGVAGGLILPHFAKKMIAQEAAERLGRPVSVERVSVNPYTLDATVEGLRVLEADRATPFVTFDRLDVEGSATSIYRWAPVIDRLTVTGLKAHLVREGDNRYNVTDILQRLEAAAKARAAEAKARGHDKEKEKPARFSVSNIRLVDAAVDFDDRPWAASTSERDPRVGAVRLEPAAPPEGIRPAVVRRQGERRAGAGDRGDAALRGRPAHALHDRHQRARRAPYLAYVPVPVKTEVESGTLDAHLEVRFTQGAGKALPSTRRAPWRCATFGLGRIRQAPALRAPRSAARLVRPDRRPARLERGNARGRGRARG
jgi:hypothetical protein